MELLSGWGGTILYLGFFFVLIYFLMIRPQKKQQQKHKSLVESLQTGDEVVTAGGIHGLVVKKKDKTVVISVDRDVNLELELTAIARIIKATTVKSAAVTIDGEKTDFSNVE